MADLLVFHQQGCQLIIEFLGAKYIERQPGTPEEIALFLESMRPVIAQLDAYALKHKLKETIELNLKDVKIAKLNAECAVHLIELMTQIRPDHKILEKIHITNSNPVFNMIYKSVRGRLPPVIRDIVQIDENSKFF